MTITCRHLEKAAKAARIDAQYFNVATQWDPMHDRSQLLDLAMACRICIDPQLNQIKWLNQAKWDMGDGYAVRHQYVDCQDFPALAEAVILAACEQFDAKGGSGG